MLSYEKIYCVPINTGFKTVLADRVKTFYWANTKYYLRDHVRFCTEKETFALPYPFVKQFFDGKERKEIYFTHNVLNPRKGSVYK